MRTKAPKISIDILVIRDDKILLGLLTPKWNFEGRRVYGVPGREIYFGEKIGDTIKRNIKEEFNCNVTEYKIVCVNANYALENHYIGIGITAKIDGNPQVLLPEDWESWEWFDRNQIPKNLFPATKNLVECYIQNKICISE
ncbi:MAG: hypothetical protein QMD77_03505 [Patescibacteria group bacterium]|nr:hypothetical protein [Patescibacteria group bacterium]